VPNKISGYKATEPLGPVTARNGSSQVLDKAQPGSSGTTTSAERVSDQVTFTGPALALQKLGAAVASAPVVDAAKVAAVKQSVQNGTYQINPARIADKIVKFESGLK